MTKTFKIGKRVVGAGHPTFIVAEMSANHAGSYEQAVAIVKAAAEAGADAIKLQTYTPDTMTIDCKEKQWFYINCSSNPETWKGKTFYEIYGEAQTPWPWHKKLQKIASDLGLILFSTPFDATAVDFLQTLKMPCYKIAAYEAIDIPLLRKVAATKKPVIMSVGFATLAEITDSVKALRGGGAKDIALLHCTTSYGDVANVAHTDLATMQDLRERFNVLAGFSDNMGGIETSVMAAALGASIIEKHLVVRHDPKILDDRFSLDKDEFKEMVQRIRLQEKMIGTASYGTRTKEEEQNKKYRRSLFIVEDMMKGEKFTAKNVRAIRPGAGLPPAYLTKVLGKKARKDIERGTPLAANMF